MEQRKISELLKLKRRNKVEQFDALSNKVENKEELRDLEMNLLTPEPIPEYVGENRRYFINSEHSVKFVFSSQEEMDFFSKYIQITEYIEKSITDIKIILDLFRAMELGEISYDKKLGKFSFQGESCIAEASPSPVRISIIPTEKFDVDECLKNGTHMFTIAYAFTVDPPMFKYIDDPTPYLFKLLEESGRKYYSKIPKHGSPENLVILEILLEKPEKIIYTYDGISDEWQMNQEQEIVMEEKERGAEQKMQHQEGTTHPESKPAEESPRRILFRRKQA